MVSLRTDCCRPLAPFLFRTGNGTSQQNLRTRFNKYVVSTRPLIGPTRENRKKMPLWVDLQRRGFSVWYRCGPEPVGWGRGAWGRTCRMCLSMHARDAWLQARMDSREACGVRVRLQVRL